MEQKWGMKWEKRAKLRFTQTLLKQLLKLPDDVFIVGAEYEAGHDIIALHIRGTNPELPEVAEGGTSPAISLYTITD